MSRRTGVMRSFAGILVSVLTAATIAACGGSGSGSTAQSLLQQTFSGPHIVKSGVLSMSLSLTPSGASGKPLSLSLSGPFQSLGNGQVPESDLSVAIQAQGHRGLLGIVSTGTHAYVTLDGSAYELPASAFQQLASSFTTAGSGTGGLSKLGINPMRWLSNPTVVGNQPVGGAPTTHIHAGIDVTALLGDLNTFLKKAASTTAGTGIPTSISPTLRSELALAVQNPRVDIWTGTSDHTLRRLSLSLGFPLPGSLSSLLGGGTSAAFQLTIQYADLNQPQTITAPATVKPFAQFETKLRGILGQLGGAGLGSLVGAATGSSSSSGSSSSGGNSPSGAGPNLSKYMHCIQRAGSDVVKMQKCATLISSGGV